MSAAGDGRADWWHFDPRSEAYWHVSKRPLQVLVYLLPFVAFYEAAMLSVLRAPRATFTNQAHKWLWWFFNEVGIESTGWYLPGAALVIVLLVWQVLARTSWRVDVPALGLMLLESALLTLPLIVLAQLIARLGAAPAEVAAVVAPAGGQGLDQLSTTGKIAISVGAGLYEELVFRMLVIAVIHVVLVDVANMRSRDGTAIAILISAALFTVYHWFGVDPGSIPLGVNVFYFLAGVFFGVIFVLRGFGIVVAVHALYDVATALWMSG